MAGDQGFLISTNLSISVESFLNRRRNYLFPQKNLLFLFFGLIAYTEMWFFFSTFKNNSCRNKVHLKMLVKIKLHRLFLEFI